ncbi:MAG: polymer-forming cytoskeletal protein [Bryobacteraceae bacterium]|nr:polymer-forming cytoskeletal protein [Bryobacteraceae bacterium]
MWNRKKDDDYSPKPATAPPAPANVTREGNLMSTIPARSGADTETPRNHAVIGKSVAIKGQIASREDLYIDGHVEGAIEMPDSRLTVGPNGKVEAGVKAREIVILGTVHGNVEAGDKIDIRKDAKLIGDLKTTRIVIEDGAYFKGSIDIARPEAKTSPRPAPSVQPATSAAPVPAGAPDAK